MTKKTLILGTGTALLLAGIVSVPVSSQTMPQSPFTNSCVAGSGGGGIAGSTGSNDNAVLRADGPGGSTLQSSLVSIDDSGDIVVPGSITCGNSVVCLIKMGDDTNFFRLVRTTGPGGFSSNTGAYEQVGASGDVFILSGPSGSPYPATHIMSSKTMVGPTQSNQPVPSALAVFQVDNTDGTASDPVIRSVGKASQSGPYYQAKDSSGGLVFEVPASGGWQTTATGSRPTCDSAHRHLYWPIANGTGVADTVAVCCKKVDDSYAWSTAFLASGTCS